MEVPKKLHAPDAAPPVYTVTTIAAAVLNHLFHEE